MAVPPKGVFPARYAYLYKLFAQSDELIDLDVLQALRENLDGVGMVHVPLCPAGLTATLRLGPLVRVDRLASHQQCRHA